MRRFMIRHLVRVGMLASLCLGALPNMASAQRAYDGQWSVLIVTQRGTCDRAYRYGISIQGGRVYYDGGMVNFTGHVAPNGAVSVRVASGGSLANGTGRLSRNQGRG